MCITIGRLVVWQGLFCHFESFVIYYSLLENQAGFNPLVFIKVAFRAIDPEKKHFVN